MNQIIVVSSAAEQYAARRILMSSGGNPIPIVPWDETIDMEQFRDKEVLIWFNKEPAYRDVIAITAKMLLSRASAVSEIDVYDEVMGKCPSEALVDGMNWDVFQSWSKTLSKECKQAPFRSVEKIQPQGSFFVDGDQSHLWSELGLSMSGGKSPRPLANADNVLRILEKVDGLAGVLWLDDFSGMVMITRNNETKQWTDDETRMLWIELQRKMGMGNLAKEPVFEAVMACAKINHRNPVTEWLDPIVWDGKPRLAGFFRDYMGADDSAFNRAVSCNFFISMIARIYDPGCKVDHMIILEGKQGARKSSALKAIAGQWFTECNEPLGGNNKDFYAVLHGKMIVEIAELDSFSKAETTKIKAIISTPTDRFRHPFGRITKDHPRMFVFVGTTNIDNYLRDATGGRRFLPITVSNIDIESITRDRDQLFAEAMVEYRNGKSWWEVPQAEAEALQESRRNVDEWEDSIAAYLGTRSSVTPDEVFRECLKIDLDKRTDQMSKRLSGCMRVLGWKKGFSREGGKGHRVWRKIHDLENRYTH